MEFLVTYLENLLKKPCWLLACVCDIWRETANGAQAKR